MCHRAGPLRLAIPILLLLAAAACTRAAEPAAPPASPTRSAAPTLRIYNWDTYIDPALLTQFEAETGAQIEYSTFGSNSVCVLQGSPNPALAQRFINFILSPTAGPALANYTRYSTPNREALVDIRPSDLTNPALYPGDDTRRRLFFLVDVGPEATDLYVQTWARVLAAHPSR